MRKILIITDKYFRGLDFLTVHDPAEFNFNNKIIFKNSPSGGSYLLNALQDLNIQDNQKIIDIGCCKGSAINTMRKLPFSEICGIEIVSYLANIAKKNLKN